jgi:hypothetical protein
MIQRAAASQKRLNEFLSIEPTIQNTGTQKIQSLKENLQDTDIIVFNKFEKSDDGNYFNIRLKEEAERRKSYSESRRNNRMKNISKSYVKHMETGTVTVTGTDTLELELVTGTKAERQDMLADVITGSLDKEQKEIANKFDNIFGNVK